MVTTTLLATTIITLLFLLSFTQAQQEYVNNKQLNCDEFQSISTFGNICNSIPSCQSYLTFKSTSPSYSTPASIAYLLNSNPSLIASSNNITDTGVIPSDTLITVPVNCSCSNITSNISSNVNNTFYQYNANYTIKGDDTYFSIANNTYEALTTCQALNAQNPYPVRDLQEGEIVKVPLRCACPTKKQRDAGFKYLLTYLVSEGDSFNSIAEMFGVDNQSVWEANELSATSVFFYFTPLSVPLKTEPPKRIQRVAPPPQSSPPPPPPVTPAGNGGSGSSKKWVVVGVVIGVVVLLLVVVFIVFFLRLRWRRRPETAVAVAKPFYDSATTEEGGIIKKGSDTTTPSTTQSWSISSEGVRYAIESLTLYKFEDLQNATGFFGEGNWVKGSVYRASFKGDAAAVKVLKGDVSGEINILKRINHTNVIRLSGFCVHKGNTYLVYEFAENGDLDDWLHGKEKKYLNSVSLSWRQRVQVAHDVADALNYLHNYTNPPHVHKNLKSGNVLLDGNFRAKVSNFGLARAVEDQGEEGGGFRLTRHVVGTQGYLPPEYIENGVITPKMDVFAFGVVILELLSGREAVGGDKNNGSGGEQMLSAMVSQVFEGDNVREKLRGFMDPALRGEYPLDLAYSMTELAKRCVARDLNSRPNISEVFMTLSKIQSSTLDWDPSDELERSRSVSQMSDS